MLSWYDFHLLRRYAFVKEVEPSYEFRLATLPQLFLMIQSCLKDWIAEKNCCKVESREKVDTPTFRRDSCRSRPSDRTGWFRIAVARWAGKGVVVLWPVRPWYAMSVSTPRRESGWYTRVNRQDLSHLPVIFCAQKVMCHASSQLHASSVGDCHLLVIRGLKVTKWPGGWLSMDG
jgi:hypothetical protein